MKQARRLMVSKTLDCYLGYASATVVFLDHQSSPVSWLAGHYFLIVAQLKEIKRRDWSKGRH